MYDYSTKFTQIIFLLFFLSDCRHDQLLMCFLVLNRNFNRWRGEKTGRKGKQTHALHRRRKLRKTLGETMLNEPLTFLMLEDQRSINEMSSSVLPQERTTNLFHLRNISKKKKISNRSRNIKVTEYGCLWDVA